jgi:hypothetical protein
MKGEVRNSPAFFMHTSTRNRQPPGYLLIEDLQIQSSPHQQFLADHSYANPCQARSPIPFWNKGATTMPPYSRFNHLGHLQILSLCFQNHPIYSEGYIDYGLESI